MTNKRSLTINDLKTLQVVNEPQLSPDGSKVAFVRQFISDKDEYTSHLFVQDVNGETSQASQWTFGDGKVASPRFSPDGQYLIFVSLKPNAKPQLQLLSLSGGEAKQITELENGASQPFWSPDSKKVLFTTAFEKGNPPTKDRKEQEKKEEPDKPDPLVVERLKYKSDAAGFLDKKRKQLAVYDLSEDSIEFLTDDEVDHEPSSWSPDSQSIAYFSNKEADDQLISDIYIYDFKTNESKRLTDGKGIYTFGVFSPNGEKIAYYGHEKEFYGATQNKVWIHHLTDNTRECITKDWDIHITDAAIGDLRSGHPNPGPIWSKDEKEIYVTASTKGSTNFYSVTIEGNIQERYTGHHHVYGYHVNVEKNIAVLGVSSPTNPGEIYVLSLESNHVRQLTSFNESLLEEVHIAEPEEIWCKAPDGWDVHGWILKPYNFKDGEKYPTILEIHGGPHAMYANTFFHELQLLAAQGYVVLYSNPRGSHGYGQSYVNACRGDYGGKDYEDLMSFVDAAVDRYDFIDTDRLGVTGGSYGGFMTNWIVSHTNRFKAAATLRSISNWISFYGVSDIGYFFAEWEIGASFLEDPEKLWKHSPLKYVKQIETPLLILHGEKDFRCPVEQAEQLFIALQHQKKETRFVRFPNANHELSRSGPPYLRYARLEELTNWFEKYLKQ
ncbi:S9 family peptidase [Evansella halocellulosilytica]|uniref:S9 family peptidase n=1 Tax=Evansella halocellulosilytica TaxID=2011013 RepID=UPI000BB8BA69|nr:S9 family peptidase [Evansella halocellulosilytica]